MKIDFISMIILVHLLTKYANAQLVPESAPSIYGLDTKIDPETAIIVVVVVSTFFFMGLLSIYLRRCAESSSSISASAVILHSSALDNRSSNRHGLDPVAIEKFPVFPYSAVKDRKIGNEALECAVCLSEFEDYETLRLLPKCNHVFHIDCIDAWLASHVTCPVCRADVTPENCQSAPQIAESSTELGHENSATQLGGELSQVSITIDADVQNQDPSGRRILGKFPRSHSTGHSLVQPGGDTERYTLILPEEVRRQIMVNDGNKLKRSISYDVVWAFRGSSKTLHRSGSSSRGKCGGAEREQQSGGRWVFSRTPPFVSRESL